MPSWFQAPLELWSQVSKLPSPCHHPLQPHTLGAGQGRRSPLDEQCHKLRFVMMMTRMVVIISLQGMVVTRPHWSPDSRLPGRDSEAAGTARGHTRACP